MLTLSEKYTLHSDAYSWRLETKIESKHHKSKEGYVIEKRYYPTISMVLAYILDEELKNIDGGLIEMAQALQDLSAELKELVKEWEAFKR